MYEARAYHEIPKEEREEIDGSDGEARSDMEDESSGGKETITEVDTVSDDEEGVAKKKKNRSKEMQHRQATRRRIVESDTDGKRPFIPSLLAILFFRFPLWYSQQFINFLSSSLVILFNQTSKDPAERVSSCSKA